MNQSGHNASWVVAQGMNAVYGGQPHTYPTEYVGNTNDAATCESLCKANFTGGGPCSVWTWHDAQQGDFALQCWFRLDHVYAPTPEGGHTSGYFEPASTPNVWAADLSSLGVAAVAGLRDYSQGVGGRRMIRARYPNGDPEVGFGSSLRATSWTAPRGALQPAVEFRPAAPLRNSSDQFRVYQAGIGGVCDATFAGGAKLGFTPPISYWCGLRGGGGCALRAQ